MRAFFKIARRYSKNPGHDSSISDTPHAFVTCRFRMRHDAFICHMCEGVLKSRAAIQTVLGHDFDISEMNLIHMRFICETRPPKMWHMWSSPHMNEIHLRYIKVIYMQYSTTCASSLRCYSHGPRDMTLQYVET